MKNLIILSLISVLIGCKASTKVNDEDVSVNSSDSSSSENTAIQTSSSSNESSSSIEFLSSSATSSSENITTQSSSSLNENFSSAIERPNGLDTSNYFMDDRDGEVYRKIRVGEYVWMAENLRYDVGNRSWCMADNDSECGRFGLIYYYSGALNYSGAVRSELDYPTGIQQGACPDGWRLPTNSDWINLLIFIAIEHGWVYNDYLDDGNNLGYYLKSTGQWFPDPSITSYSGNDFYNFSVLNAGYSDWSRVQTLKKTGFWASADENPPLSNEWMFTSSNNSVNQYNDNTALHVRCVQVGSKEEVSLDPFEGYEKMIDSRDDNEYPIIEIDGLTWMAQNLRYKTKSGAYCHEEGLSCDYFGYLYSLETIYDNPADSLSLNSVAICPDGWHLPNLEEWSVMIGASFELLDSVEYKLKMTEIGKKLQLQLGGGTMENKYYPKYEFASYWVGEMGVLTDIYEDDPYLEFFYPDEYAQKEPSPITISFTNDAEEYITPFANNIPDLLPSVLGRSEKRYVRCVKDEL